MYWLKAVYRLEVVYRVEAVIFQCVESVRHSLNGGEGSHWSRSRSQRHSRSRSCLSLDILVVLITSNDYIQVLGWSGGRGRDRGQGGGGRLYCREDRQGGQGGLDWDKHRSHGCGEYGLLVEGYRYRSVLTVIGHLGYKAMDGVRSVGHCTESTVRISYRV